MSLIAELKRRNVLKVGAAYVVVAWLAVQAVSIGFPAFDAPPWVLRVFILVALLGFPVVLVMTWVLDLTPEGLRVDTAAPGTKRLFTVAAVLVALAIGWYFYGQPAVRRMASEPAPTATPAIPAKSIAVLAFTDLSPKHDQEYFSDGIAEEILNALAQVKDLKVAGRTSSFHYKGRNEDLRTIGRALGVAHVLEGSVRSQGNRVRITAQLVRTADNFHVWSRAYDGELTDVFELQERIARAITDELQVALEGGQKIRLVNASTTNPEAYALYLQATGIFNRREGARMPEAIAKLERAIALDPSYARAHSRLAAVEAIATVYRPEDSEKLWADSRREAQRALELDPTLAEPHAALGVMFGQQRRFIEQRQEFERAIELDPNDVTANFWLATGLITTGYLKQGNAMLDRVLAIDPLLPNALSWRGRSYIDEGEIAAGEHVVRLAQRTGLAHVGLNLSDLAARRGQRGEAIRQLASALRVLAPVFSRADAMILAEGAYGDAAARVRALELIRAYQAKAEDRTPTPGAVPYLLLKLHEPVLALRVAQDGLLDNDPMFLSLLWGPQGREARLAPGFPEFARRMGLAVLWDRYGAPDLCRRVGPRDYVCR